MSWRLRIRTRWWLAGLGAGGLAVVSCGIGLHGELNQVAPQDVVFEDRCGLQDYFDTLSLRKAQPPTVLSTHELERTEGHRSAGGRTKFAFETEFQLRTVRRLLSTFWTRVPEPLLKRYPIELEVHWSERAGVRRVVTDADAEIAVAGETWALPYHVCLSELLFGAPLYATRREMLGLPALLPPADPPRRVILPVLAPTPDAGAPDAAR